MHMLRLVDNNKAKNYLTFKYCLPISLLISYVKTIFNHWSGKVGRSGLQLHRILTCISGEINVWINKCFDTPKSAHSVMSNIQLFVFIDIFITLKSSSVIICTFITQMDQQIVDPGLNITIQRDDLDWRPTPQNGKKHVLLSRPNHS